MNEQEAKTQEQYYQLDAIDKQLRKMHQRLLEVDSQVKEITKIKDWIDEMKDVKEGSDALVPLANGIFVKAKLYEPTKLSINIGKGVVVEKKSEEAKELLDKQIKEIVNYKEQLLNSMNNLEMQAQQIEMQFKRDAIDNQ